MSGSGIPDWVGNAGPVMQVQRNLQQGVGMAANPNDRLGPGGWSPGRVGGGGGAGMQAQAMTFAGPNTPGSPGGPTRGPVSGSTPVNPMQSESYDAAKNYSDSLMNSTNEMVTREMGRARDEISVGMGREGENAISRGADPSLFRTRAMQFGQRGMNDLQAKLADVNLGRQAEGIGLQTNAANAGAGEQRLMHLGTMSQGLQEQRLLLEQQEMQNRLNQQPYDRLMEMMKNLGSGVFGGYGTGVLGQSGPTRRIGPGSGYHSTSGGGLGRG